MNERWRVTKHFCMAGGVPIQLEASRTRKAGNIAKIVRCEATRKNKDAFAPELGDYFADGPVLLWAQAAVNRHLDDWYAELLAEHQAEGHEDAMVESRTRISASVLAAGLKLGRRASFLTSLRTLSTMRDTTADLQTRQTFV